MLSILNILIAVFLVSCTSSNNINSINNINTNIANNESVFVKPEVIEQKKQSVNNQVNIVEVNNQSSVYNIFSNYPNSIKYKDHHSKSVIIAFLDKDGDFVIDNNTNLKNINLISFRNTDANNLSGIINMSYAYFRNIENMHLLNKESEYINNKGFDFKKPFLEFVTKRYFDDSYIWNNSLKIAALGNQNRSSVKKPDNFSSALLEPYQKMKPELQELFRSETILAKNQVDSEVIANWNKFLNDMGEEDIKLDFISYVDENNNKYYEYILKNKVPQTKPYLLRSFTVGANGFVIDKNGDLQSGQACQHQEYQD